MNHMGDIKMKDYKQLFGYAAIIMAIGFLVRSFMPAYAFNGPTVSMGSNPIENFYGSQYMSGGASTTILANTSSSSFVITQYLSNEYSCTIQVDGLFPISEASSSHGYQYLSTSTKFTGTLLIPSGSTLSFKNLAAGSQFCKYYIEGYYTH